jgi:2-methylcitrate dehydratase PrpD
MSEPPRLNDATKKVARFISETTIEKIPAEAIAMAKKAFLDYIGVTVGGSAENVSKIMFEYVKNGGGKAEAGIFCQPFKTSAELAALANGTAGHALDFDDTIPGSVHYNLHPSVGIIPAVIALGEKYKLSGLQVLASYIVGLEVQYRVGLAMGQHVAPSGWHSTGILGSIGAVAAAANMLKLTADQTRMAIGIGGSLTCGMVRNLDTMTKPMHAGNAARNGVVSAELAKIGYGANPDTLDGKFSFCSMFSGYKSQELGDKADNLGEQWDIVTRGLLFKAWPCCRANHGNIEAVLNMRDMPGMDVNQIESIVSKTHPIIPVFASRHKPLTGYEGKFSIGYCMAVALTKGRVVLEDFTDEQVKDPLLQAIAAKCSYVHPEGWGVGTVDPKVEVTIKLKNGREFTNLVVLPKGEPENPLTDTELADKFRNCANVILRNEQVEQLYNAVMTMEKMDSINVLIGMTAARHH